MQVNAEQFIVMLSLIGPAFGLMDWIGRGQWRNVLGLIGWSALLICPGLFFPTVSVDVYAPPIIVAVLLYMWARPRMKNQTQSEATLLFFCNHSSVAWAGASAAYVIAFFLFSVGLLGHHEDFTPRHYGFLLTVPLVVGASLSFAKKAIRAKYPTPVAVSFAASGAGAAGGGVGATMAHGMGGQTASMPGGLMRDELIMAVVLTPVLWPLLSSVFPIWNLFFLFGMIFLPSLFIYVAWSGLQRSFLRWIGRVDRQAHKQFIAYERLTFHEQLGHWLGELTITFDEDDEKFVVHGTLPERHLVLTLRHVLTEFGNDVDCDGVIVDPSIAPNPWFQLALSRRDARRQKDAG